MNDHAGVATERLTEPMVCASAEGMQPVGAGPGTVLLLAAWIGLIAGFLDLGLIVVSRRLISRDFYRLGGDFTWIIPLGVTILVLVPAIVIALIARMRGGTVRLGVVVEVLSFVGFLDVWRGFPWKFGQRCSYALGSPHNWSGCCAPAIRLSSGSFAARSHCSPESF